MDTEHQVKVDRHVCANCGGTIRWNITKQCLECSSCRTPYTAEATVDLVEEHDFYGYIQREEETLSFPDATIIVCGTCGAQIAVDEYCTATVCPMCGSTQLLESRQEVGVPPDGVIPFRVDRDTAQQNFSKWVKSRWFAPNRLKQAYQAGKLQGIYLPFCTFDAQVTSTYHGKGGKTHTVRDKEGKTRTEVLWEPVHGTICSFYNDLQVCATLNSASQVVEQVLPYNTSDNTIPFSPSYLSGFLAERYAIPATQAVDTAKETIYTSERNQARTNILSQGFSRAQLTSVHTEYHSITYKHVLLPAWVSAFSYNGKQYMYIINGESGKVGGQRPYSVPKIMAALAAAVAAITFIMLLLTGAAAPSSLHEEEVTPPQAILMQVDSSSLACEDNL